MVDTPISEKNKGMHSVLSFASVYSGLQKAIGAVRMRQTLVDRYIRPEAGQRIVDLGCGPSDLLDLLPAVEYIGLEPNPDYVENARARFGDRGTWICGGIDTFDPTPWAGTCQRVISIGVLHHLDDALAGQLLATAQTLLAPGGHFVALDGCYVDGQSRVARTLLDRDRGQHVRSETEMRALVEPWFPGATVTVHHDMLRVPYTHSIVEAGLSEETE